MYKKSLLLAVSACLAVCSLALSQEEGTVTSSGVAIHYRIFGEGHPLLILNGGPGFPSNHFSGLAKRLAKGRQAILFDQRGTGKSKLEKVDSTTVTVALMLEDIEALRRHLGIEQWVVMGHSWGGMYAMSYAARYPERVQGLLLSASGGVDLDFAQYLNANIRSRISEEERRQLDYLQAHPGVEGARRQRLEAIAPAYVYHREHVSTVVHYLTEESQFEPRINSLVWQDLYRTGYNLREALADFGKPALILQGRQDLLGESTAYELQAALPTARLALINECSHYLWLDQPESYFEQIEDFLTGLLPAK